MKCSVKIDEKLQKEINHKLWVNSLISLIVGSIGIGSYMVVGLFIENYLLDLFLWIMAFTFAIGLTMLTSINKINKKSAQNNITDELEITEEYVVTNSIKNNEIISTVKTYYKDLHKIRETENYLVLYLNKAAAVPIPKDAFTKEELSTIKLWVYAGKGIKK